MTGKKLIAILGITGTQGSSVAIHFLKHPNWQIRGLTRNPSSPKAQSWASRGVEIVQADQNDPDSLRRAFRGANAIFAVTDYAGNWKQVAGTPGLPEKSVDERAGDLERTQGLNVAAAAADPEVLATLDRFVFSTLPAVKKLSGGRYARAWEFDSKAAVEARVRREMAELARRMSTVTMGIYLESWKDIAALAPHSGEDGDVSFVRLDAPGPYQRHPLVVATEDAGAFVEALVLRHPPGTDVLGFSGNLSWEEYAALWGRVMGVKTRVRDVGEDEFRARSPEEIRDTLVDLFRFFAEYGYAAGNPRMKTPADLGIETSSLETWIKNEDWSSVFKG